MLLAEQSSQKVLWLRHSKQQQKPGGNIPKPEEGAKGADGILPKPKEKPNRKVTWGGSITMESTAKYDVSDMSDKPKIDEEFNKEHEVTQHEVAVELAKDVQANKFDIIDGEADIDEEVVERKVMEALVAKQDKLRVQIFDFELDKFETSIRKQIEYTTQFADKLAVNIKDSLLPPELQKSQTQDGNRRQTGAWNLGTRQRR